MSTANSKKLSRPQPKLAEAVWLGRRRRGSENCAAVIVEERRRRKTFLPESKQEPACIVASNQNGEDDVAESQVSSLRHFAAGREEIGYHHVTLLLSHPSLCFH